MQDTQDIKERIAFLFTALQYCSTTKQTFKAGERIMINQERFQWMHILSHPWAQPRIVSEAIESKLSIVAKAIADIDQQLLNENLFKDGPTND
jgi:hypothetical protein